LVGRAVAEPRGALEVRSHRTSRLISFPVVIANYVDERCLAAMLGERTNWVAAVRAGADRSFRHLLSRAWTFVVRRFRESRLPAALAGTPRLQVALTLDRR
jgi:hypothetical protein